MSNKTNAPTVVYGADCLNYVNKPIGFGSRELVHNPNTIDVYATNNWESIHGYKQPGWETLAYDLDIGNKLGKLNHDTSKRIIGLVLDRYDDGGLKVALLGDESFHIRDMETAQFSILVRSGQKYKYINVVQKYKLDEDAGSLPMYPDYVDDTRQQTTTGSQACIRENTSRGVQAVPFDEAIDYVPTFVPMVGIGSHALWEYQGQPFDQTGFTITNNPNNTMVGGVGLKNISMSYDVNAFGNPLSLFSGNLYGFMSDEYFNYMMGYGSEYDPFQFTHFEAYPNLKTCTSYNLCFIPYNLILTENDTFAAQYLETGALPPDAFLYPLDWENLPGYQYTETEPEDNPDDKTPDDNSRTGNPNLPQVPTYTPSMLSNYNWYWLSVPDYSAFLTWFWNDIGNYNDFSDLIAKVEGLYNDVASAVLMVRYFPVEISWIGGLGTQSNIKVGMIEKNGAVDTISQANPPAVRDIGNIHIPTKYNSFCDLAPYTELSLYLPFHGFIDMDIDILMGHDLYIKGVYDYLTGTLQYMIYVDNLYLINTVIVKLAVDIPITLQTKNDRDSAVFSNVTSTVGGLIGAGLGVATGNPIGITMGVANGVQSLNANNTSAPLNVKGTVGESGALYCPPQCAIILRRPTIQSSDGSSSLKTWKKNVGNMCGYGYTLSSLVGKGLTVCYTPRINFTKSTPMQSEVEEIYTYLQEGVIL